MILIGFDSIFLVLGPKIRMGLLAGSKHPRDEVDSDKKNIRPLLEEEQIQNGSSLTDPLTTSNTSEVESAPNSDSSSEDSFRSDSGFSSSRSTSSFSSLSSAESGEDDEAVENFIQHVKLTGDAMRKRERNSMTAKQGLEVPDATSSMNHLGGKDESQKKTLKGSELLFGALKVRSSFNSSPGGKQHASQSAIENSSSPADFSLKAKLDETLRALQEELQPSAPGSSNELVLYGPNSAVDAGEESAMVMERLIARKIPPPLPEDAKKLRRLEPVDHTRIAYMNVEKVFYQYPSFTFSTPSSSAGGNTRPNSGRVPHPILKKMLPKDVENGMDSSSLPVLSPARWKAILLALDGAKVRGRNPPLPLLNASALSSSLSVNRTLIGGSSKAGIRSGEDSGEEEDRDRKLHKDPDQVVAYSGSWDGTGLSDAVLEHLSSEGYREPFAVQALAVPVLMSGRDLLLTAKTGSGKTLGYVLPLVRHCAQQARCGPGEGPIGLVLVPTQELAVQVFSVMDKLCRVGKLRTCTGYGSTSLTENVKLVKVGCDAMVATPGRLLDLLTINHCTTLRLYRVSFVVVDEADRMFDSGFKGHVEAFLRNIRPDRQLAMVSATLPRELKKEILKHMNDPIEISIGGRPTPASNVEQQFYFFEEEVYEINMDEDNRVESPRLLKLLQILGEECIDRGSSKNATADRSSSVAHGDRPKTQGLILIFTQRKEEVDELMAKLTTLGYDRRIATLYSGMDPVDRQFALENFNPENQFILIATSVAERGLDIPQLELVINYALPDHVEAYVHRIGRTGRAGKNGRAISFFRHRVDDDLAPELADALERSGQPVPEALYEVSAKVRELRREGATSYRVGFYRGYQKGKHHQMTNRQQKDQLRDAAKGMGLEEFLSSEDEDDEEAERRRAHFSSSDSDEDEPMEKDGIKMVHMNKTQNDDRNSLALTVARSSSSFSSGLRNTAAGQMMDAEERVSKALNFARDTTAVVAAKEGNTDASGVSVTTVEDHAANIRFHLEYEINQLPNYVRGNLLSKKLLLSLQEELSVSIVRKGIYVDPQRQHTHRLKEGDRPLYLLVIGKTPEAVRETRDRLDKAKAECMDRMEKKKSAATVLF